MISHYSPTHQSLSQHCPSAHWIPQIQQLQHQLQRRLKGRNQSISDKAHSSRSHRNRSQLANPDCFHLVQLSSALTVLSGVTQAITTASPETPLRGNEREDAQSGSTIQWALGINAADQSEQCAQKGVLEFWSVDTQQVEVSIYRAPTRRKYQKQAVFHVGDRISPEAFPNITLEVQEPLPLHFLTRTASGIKTNTLSQLPLKLIL